MPKSLITFKRIIIHLIIWCIYGIYEISIILFIQPAQLQFIQTVIGFVLNALLFYTFANYVYPKWLSWKTWIFAVIHLFLLLFLYVYVSFILRNYVFIYFKNHTPIGAILFNETFIAQHLWRGLWFIGLSLGYWFAKKSVKAEQSLRILERERYLKEIKEQELQKEIVVAQLLSLKNQINPHFLFNTLNFFYSSISPLSKSLAASLQKLSDIMRYGIKDVEQDGLSDLVNEIQQVYNYIDLNRLRYPDKLYVDFKIFGMAEHKRILSSAMMTLVENAFKYGELTDPRYPLIINLNIQFETFEFEIRNRKNNITGLESNGIGLKNLMKRLQLVYVNNYSIDIQENEIMFSCKLKINMIDG